MDWSEGLFVVRGLKKIHFVKLQMHMLPCKHSFFSIWPATQTDVLSKINLCFQRQVTTVTLVMLQKWKKLYQNSTTSWRL